MKGKEWYKNDELAKLVAHFIIRLNQAGYDANLHTLTTGTGVLVWEKEDKHGNTHRITV